MVAFACACSVCNDLIIFGEGSYPPICFIKEGVKKLFCKSCALDLIIKENPELVIEKLRQYNISF